MNTLVAFILTGLIWSADGSVERPLVLAFVSKGDCEAAGKAFGKIEQEEMDGRAPAFKGSFYWDCRRVINTSVARHA